MSSQKEQTYLMETEDGFTVRVPESKLEAWQQAQARPVEPLNRAEQQVRDRILERLYGEKK